MSDTDNQEKDTLVGSSPELETTETDHSGNSVTEESQPQPERIQTAEEVEFNSLSGSAQDRIRSVIQERNQLRDQLARQAEIDAQAVSTPSQPTVDDEVMKAAKLLQEKAGFVSKNDVAQEINQVLNRIETDRIHSTLEKEFDGSDGRPKYVREEVEDYARRSNIWNLKAAYRDMYFDELQDTARVKKKQVYSTRPRASAPTEPVTLDSFRASLRGEKGREVYEKLLKNPQEYDKILQQLTQAE